MEPDNKKVKMQFDNSQLSTDLSNLLTVSLNLKSDDEIIAEVNRLISQYGLDAVKAWRAKDKHQHCLLHILVNFNKQQAIRALADLSLAQIDEQRPSDNCTPLHLSSWKKNVDLSKILLQFGANPRTR